MLYDLVVMIAFGGHKIGDRITDADQIASILASPDSILVRRVYHSEGTQPVALPAGALPDETVVYFTIGGVAYPFTVAQLRAYLGATEQPPETTGLTITVSSIQVVPSGTALAIALAANRDVSWAKTGGADADLFQLAGTTLSLPAQDYFAPTDANADNAYAVEVTATDGTGVSVAKTILVMVSAPPVTPPTGSPSDLTTDFDDETNLALKSSIGI